MSRSIIDYDEKEYHGLLVNTFWGGKGKGECVQFTEGGPGDNNWERKGYVQMSRLEAIEFVTAILYRLNKQTVEDQVNPPWWQEI